MAGRLNTKFMLSLFPITPSQNLLTIIWHRFRFNRSYTDNYVPPVCDKITYSLSRFVVNMSFSCHDDRSLQRQGLQQLFFYSLLSTCASKLNIQQGGLSFQFIYCINCLHLSLPKKAKCFAKHIHS